jgi:hypothetical protein
MTTLESLPDEFVDLVQEHPTSGCWFWCGGTSPKEYPVFRRRAAWKWAYEWIYGPIPQYGTHPTIEGCEGGSLQCVNPDHRTNLPRDQALVRHRCSVCAQWHDPE